MIIIRQEHFYRIFLLIRYKYYIVKFTNRKIKYMIRYIIRQQVSLVFTSKKSHQIIVSCGTWTRDRISRDQHSLVKFTTIVKYDGAQRAPRGTRAQANSGEQRAREGGKAGGGPQVRLGLHSAPAPINLFRVYEARFRSCTAPLDKRAWSLYIASPCLGPPPFNEAIKKGHKLFFIISSDGRASRTLGGK